MPEGFNITLKLNDLFVNPKDELINPRMANIVGVMARAQIKKNFAMEGNPKWAPLAESTQKSKVTKGGARRGSAHILRGSPPRLMNSIEYEVVFSMFDATIKVGPTAQSDDGYDYGIPLQFGTPHMPARPFLFIPLSFTDVIADQERKELMA